MYESLGNNNNIQTACCEPEISSLGIPNQYSGEAYPAHLNQLAI